MNAEENYDTLFMQERENYLNRLFNWFNVL